MARHRSSIHKKDDFAAHPKPSAEPFQPRPFADPAVEETTHSLANNAPSILDKLVALPARSAPIQPKLTIGAPGDKYEQEADRVASQVVRQIHAPQTNASVQRESIEEDELQMKPDSLQMESIEDEDELQMRPATEAVEGGSASKDLEAAIHQARGSGQTLDPSLQRQMGQALGADFSGVTIHTDSQSDQLNRSIQAKAFTTGQDIFFRQGAYQPSSQSGQELIAHELTHVVQQNHGVVRRSSAQAATPLSSNISSAQNDLIQAKKVLTMGGEWEANPQEYNNVVGGNIPVRGVDIKIEFTPNASVNATKIGLTQMITSLDNNQPSQAGSDQDKFRQQQEIQIQNGPHEGSMIDRGGHAHNNPIYGSEINPTGDIKQTTFHQDEQGHSQLGRCVPGEDPVKAMLSDTPHRQAPLLPNSRQEFESTALALDGVQAGTYYGSVQWGWETDGQGAFRMIDFDMKNFGNPTPRFLASAQQWNQGRSNVGERVVPNPVGKGLVREKFIKGGQNVALPLPGAPGQERLLSLPTQAEFKQMKKDATQSRTPGSGQLSVKDYGKLETRYNNAIAQADLATAKGIVDQLVVYLTTMNAKSNKYWKSTELKEQRFTPFYNAIQSLAKALQVKLAQVNNAQANNT